MIITHYPIGLVIFYLVSSVYVIYNCFCCNSLFTYSDCTSSRWMAGRPCLFMIDKNCQKIWRFKDIFPFFGFNGATTQTTRWWCHLFHKKKKTGFAFIFQGLLFSRFKHLTSIFFLAQNGSRRILVKSWKEISNKHREICMYTRTNTKIK